MAMAPVKALDAAPAPKNNHAHERSRGNTTASARLWPRWRRASRSSQIERPYPTVCRWPEPSTAGAAGRDWPEREARIRSELTARSLSAGRSWSRVAQAQALAEVVAIPQARQAPPKSTSVALQPGGHRSKELSVQQHGTAEDRKRQAISPLRWQVFTAQITPRYQQVTLLLGFSSSEALIPQAAGRAPCTRQMGPTHPHENADPSGVVGGLGAESARFLLLDGQQKTPATIKARRWLSVQQCRDHQRRSHPDWKTLISGALKTEEKPRQPEQPAIKP